MMALGKIDSVAVVDATHLKIGWDDRSSTLVDLTHLMATRPQLASIRDATEFSRVAVSADGWSLEWPSGIDFGAPQLRRWSEEQRTQTPLDAIDA